MNVNNNIKEFVSDNLKRNTDFKFIAGLEDLTLSDIDSIEEMATIKNIKSELAYQIVDNIYIKIEYSLH